MSRGNDPRETPYSRKGRDGHEDQPRTAEADPQPTEPGSPFDTLSEPTARGALRARPTEPREVHEIRGRTYRLRVSEIGAMVEIGKFRAVAQEDLIEFFYQGDKARFRPDLENAVRQGLVELKAIPHEETGSRTLFTLTKQGRRFLKEVAAAPKDQALYHGFVRPREAHHDADLYRLFQKAAEKIERAGGRNLRVILDYELKKRLYHDLAKLGAERHSSSRKGEVAERHQLQMVRGKIPVPDLRIEYETREGEKARIDLELATGHYGRGNLHEKARAGFSIYARGADAVKLRRILDERELTAEILSL